LTLMSVIILKNIATEGPGTIEDFLRDNGISYRILEMSANCLSLTQDADILVIMGGPMSVNESDIYPFMKVEIDLVREFIRKGKDVRKNSDTDIASRRQTQTPGETRREISGRRLRLR
jgi:GMP synthase-like glutamine amidotransferase